MWEIRLAGVLPLIVGNWQGVLRYVPRSFNEILGDYRHSAYGMQM